jgi:beta-galactosidase/beta-glucuronidase
MWRVRVVAVLSVILCSADSSGQQPNRAANADVTVAAPEPPSPYFSVLKSRVRQSLDGQWRFRFDARDTGETKGWFRTGVRDRICQVPGSWQIVFEDLSNTVGIAWYEREFRLDARFRNRRIAVVFCGANYYARIWVNGQLAGEHEGGQLPFALDISRLARFDRANRITVRVSDPADQLELPVGPAHTEMHRVSGIWRGVWLEATGTTYVSDLHAAPDIDAAAAHIQTSITSPPRDREKSTTLRLLALRTDGRQHAAQIRLVLPKSDKTYSIVVKATIKIDDPWRWTIDRNHGREVVKPIDDSRITKAERQKDRKFGPTT